MARLGVNREPFDLYTSLDAAVASIILLPVDKRLPQWTNGELSARAVYRARPQTASQGAPVADPPVFDQLGDQRARLRLARGLPPDLAAHAFMLHLTSSAASDDCFGYCDFALGSVAPGRDVTASACAVISRNWRRKYRLWPLLAVRARAPVPAEEFEHAAHAVALLIDPFDAGVVQLPPLD